VVARAHIQQEHRGSVLEKDLDNRLPSQLGAKLENVQYRTRRADSRGLHSTQGLLDTWICRRSPADLPQISNIMRRISYIVLATLYLLSRKAASVHNIGCLERHRCKGGRRRRGCQY
jgi:hypothetical protein